MLINNDYVSLATKRKDRTFWKGHKNLKKSPTWFGIHYVNVKSCGRLFQIFWLAWKIWSLLTYIDTTYFWTKLNVWSEWYRTALLGVAVIVFTQNRKVSRAVIILENNPCWIRKIESSFIHFYREQSSPFENWNGIAWEKVVECAESKDALCDLTRKSFLNCHKL